MRNTIAFSIFVLGIFAQSTHARPLLDQTNCLADLTKRAEGASYEALTDIARTLTKRDLKCLFKEAAKNGAPSRNFFAPIESGLTKSVAIIFGKNSLPFLNTFEKHVFSTRSMLKDANDTTEDLFGYNYHPGMNVTGPGFFKIKQSTPSIVIDFTDDFVSEIAPEDLALMSGIKTIATRNNRGNIFYGGDTKDYCLRLLYDEKLGREAAVVCEGYRSFFGHRHAFIWDILIRKWD